MRRAGSDAASAVLKLASAGLICLALQSCAYPTRNYPATEISDTSGYRWVAPVAGDLDDTLVIVTASGGGTRAAALELSVLEGMHAIRLTHGASATETLSDRIDILSSVSGGSVTAAYFALHVNEKFETIESTLKADFLAQDGFGAILLSGLNPVGLARLSTHHVERIDLLIDYFDKTLFKNNETYSLLKPGKRPFLILNAADMVEETPFAFTQTNFDLLCSDLTRMNISTAVAASAAFPLALSPVTLQNYSPCPAQHADWPPGSVQAEAATDWSVNADRAMLGRAELAYANGNEKKYIHLLDGGIADNLGIAEPLRILTRNDPEPGFLDRISDGRYKKIVFIMINARSFATSELDASQATPGIVDMLMGSVFSAIDRASAGAADRLRSALNRGLGDKATEFEVKSKIETYSALQRQLFAAKAANLTAIQNNTYLIEVDFDAIDEVGPGDKKERLARGAKCRQDFHNIGTNWTNTDREIDSLLRVGKALLVRSKAFDGMLGAIGGEYQGERPTLEAACTGVAAKD